MAETSAEINLEFGPADRRAVASVATQFFVNGTVFASFIPRLPEIRDRIDVSIDVLGALMTVAGAIGLIGSASSSRLIEHYGTRRVLIVGAAFLIATLPVIGFATVPAVFVAGLAALAALDVVVDVSMNLQGSWLSARRHAPIMNRLHGLWSLGTVIGGLVAAQVTAAGVSLQVHLVVVAAVLALALVFVGRGLLPDDEQPRDNASRTEYADVELPSSQLSRWPLIGLGLAGAFAIAVEVVSNDWAAFRLRDDFETSAGLAGLGFVAFTSGMTAGRFGGDWTLQRIGPTRMGQLAVLAAALGLAGAALGPNHYLVLASYFVAGVGISTFFPRLYDEAAQLPGRRGAGLGALTAGSRIAALGVPIAVGGLAATSLTVGGATALIVLPSVTGFGIVMATRGKRSSRRPNGGPASTGR